MMFAFGICGFETHAEKHVYLRGISKGGRRDPVSSGRFVTGITGFALLLVFQEFTSCAGLPDDDPAPKFVLEKMPRMRNSFNAHKSSHDYMDIDEFMLEAIAESRLKESILPVAEQHDNNGVCRMSLSQMLANAVKEHQLLQNENSSQKIRASTTQKSYLESVSDVPQDINDIDDDNILNCFLPVKGIDFGKKVLDSEDEVQKYKSAFRAFANTTNNSNSTFGRPDDRATKIQQQTGNLSHEDQVHIAHKNYLESVLDVPQDINDIDDDNILNCFLPVKGIDFGRKEKDFEDEVQKYKSTFSESVSMSELLLDNVDMRQLFAFSGIHPKNFSASSFDGKSEVKKQEKEHMAELCGDSSRQSSVSVEDDQEYQDEDSSSAFPKEIKKRKPRTYKYNPKPVQHKTRRSFVPDVLKDIDYWERRKRNNEAAKKSRQERRKKELEVLTGLDALRDENDTLRSSLKQLQSEMDILKSRNEALEKQVSELLDEKK